MKSIVEKNVKSAETEYPCLKLLDEGVFYQHGCYVVVLMEKPGSGTVVNCSEEWKERFGVGVGHHEDGWNEVVMKKYTGRVILEND